MSISPLALGLGKLISKGDWSFWWGDGTWYDLKAPLGNRSGWSYGEIIFFSYHDNEVRFSVDSDNWRDNLLSKPDQVYLRDIWTRLYFDPVMAAQEKARKQEAIEKEARTKGRIAELEALGNQS